MPETENYAHGMPETENYAPTGVDKMFNAGNWYRNAFFGSGKQDWDHEHYIAGIARGYRLGDHLH